MTRLIDADALCEFLRRTSTRQNYMRLALDNDNYTVAGVLEAVCEDLEGKSIHGFDNVPTVEAYTYHDVKIANNNGYVTAMKEYARPKGEWRDASEKNIFYEEVKCFECSNCHKRKVMDVLIYEKLPFCPNCGAEMVNEERTESND